MITYKDELYHHGIKGQRWGIRRYRNSDGSLTEAGKQRYGDEQTFNKQHRRDVAKKVALGLTVVAAAGLTAYAIKNPARAGELAADFMNKAAPKIKDFGKKAAKGLSESLSQAGKAATDAVLAVAAATAVSKIAQKYDTSGDPNDPNTIRNKMIVDASSAAINKFASTATGSNSSSKSNNSGNKGAQVGKEVSDKIGPPSNKPVDKSSEAWQALFKDKNGNNRDDTTRATIKALQKKGHDIDQIKKYLEMIDSGEIRHSDVILHAALFEHYSPYFLAHHGVKGQRWGVRRYRNEDGSLTNAGKKRYLKGVESDMKDQFNSRISPEARKVAAIGRNGFPVMGSRWTDAYRKGKVTSKDASQVSRAAGEARKYIAEKYGDDVFRNLQKGELFRKTEYDFEPTADPFSRTKADNYKSQQRTRDKKLYGERAVDRINKRMLAGEGIQSARHNEVKRKQRIDNAKVIGGKVLKGTVAVGVPLGMMYLANKKGLFNSGSLSDTMTLNEITKRTASVGLSVVDAMLGRR